MKPNRGDFDERPSLDGENQRLEREIRRHEEGAHLCLDPLAETVGLRNPRDRRGDLEAVLARPLVYAEEERASDAVRELCNVSSGLARRRTRPPIAGR